MSISELRNRLREELLEFAWGQWAQLGVSGHSASSDRWAIDPEALVLFTIEVSRRDPRLFDELLDWLARNGRLLILRRLRNLVTRFPVDSKLVEAVIERVGEEAPSLRWLKNDGRVSARERKTTPVFTSEVLSFIGEPDPVFVRFGYVRPRVKRSLKSREPDFEAPINLVFRLRLLFGPGSRSEVMSVLLTSTSGPLDAARIADQVGFTKRNVSEALNALAESGVVMAQWSTNERVFQGLRERWATLLNLGPGTANMPTFVSWVHLLPPLARVLLWSEREAESKDSEYLISSRARDLAETIGPDLERIGLRIPASRSLLGAAYLPAFMDTAESLLAAIR